MFDFWRNLTKSKADKEREQLHAYLDNALPAAERAQFEARLAQDAELRVEVESLREVKQRLAAVPRRPVPRNFTLDPAQYGRPAPQPLLQAQPALRLATVLTAVVFIVVFALDWITPSVSQPAFFAAEMPQEVAVMEDMVEERLMNTEEATILTEEEAALEPLAEPIEITRVVTETLEEPMAEEAVSAQDDDEVVTERMATPVASPTIITPQVRMPEAAAVPETAVTSPVVSPETITTVPPTAPEPKPPPLRGQQWLQLGLGSLLALLLLLLFLAHRQASV
jgi:hypothetical protein